MVPSERGAWRVKSKGESRGGEAGLGAVVASGAPIWAYPKSWKQLSYTILSTLWKAHSASFEESVERDSVGEGQAPARNQLLLVSPAPSCF